MTEPTFSDAPDRDDGVTRICLWSGPRNVSTALMYSFGERSDTKIVDEPLYAHYLRHSGAAHPGRERVLDHQDTDGDRVVRDVILGPSTRPVLFVKGMAHHLINLDWAFLARTKNVILTRDPTEVIPSLARKLGNVELSDAGYEIQVTLLRHLEALGQSVPVLEAKALLADPRSVLERLCSKVGIPFDADMLQWKAGPRKDDGVWADIWYTEVHKTTGFAPYRRRETPIPGALAGIVEESLPLYAELKARMVPNSIDP